jgi:hypothetical protein
MKLITSSGMFKKNRPLHSATSGLNPRKKSMLMSLAGRISLFAVLAVFGVLLAMPQTSRAQAIYTNTFNTDDSANWVKNYSYSSNPNFLAVSNMLYNFNFDYTTAGIPIAPHSALFGSDTIHHALKISACYTNAATLKGSAVTTGMSVSPTNFSITTDFVMHADVWINVDCSAYPALNTNNYNVTNVVSGTNVVVSPSFADNNHDGTASTVFYGCGYGTQGTVATTPGVTDAIWVGMLTDNGTSAQYRMYGPSIQSSYQDGNFQTSGTGVPAFPGDPYVYNMGSVAAGPGCREVIDTTGNPPFASTVLATNLATGVPWGTIFPPAVVPLAQQNLYPQQTNNASCPGLVSFAWHDVSVEKIGSVIVYLIDGNIIATGNYASAGTPPGSYLTFVATRTATSVASPATGALYTNLNFALFANIVVSNYNNVVNVSASTPTTSEATPSSPGVFTLTRSSIGVPVTVNYTLTGTATNGFQYQTIATNVTFASTAMTTNINIVPIDDGIPNPTTTVLLTIQPGTNYTGAGNAVVSILDNDPTTIDINTNYTSQAYGRYTNTDSTGDFINYTLTRRGKLTTGNNLTVNLSYSGSAVSGTDFTPVSSVTVPDGSATASFTVSPIDNPNVTTNRTVIINVASGANYAVGNGSATGTIVSAHYPTAPVLLFDDLTSPTDATNWSITYGCGDPVNDATDYEANFGLNLSSGSGGYPVPPPPGGANYALHLTCNKDVTPGSGGAVNAYYTNLFLNGNYAVRFSMNLIEGQTTAYNTEGVMFGINHTGTCSNWWYGNGPITTNNYSSDGVWYYVTAQPSGTVTGDYQEYTGLGGTNNNTGWTRLDTQVQSTYTQVFKDNPGPFTCLDGFGNQTAGSPANGSPALGYDDSTWSDVEIKQLNNVVTMSINHTAIFVYTNTTVWTNGYLMLGYADPFGANIGSPEAGAYFANLQVVSLPSSAPTTVTINSIAISGGNVIVKFTTSSASDTISSFTLTSSGTVSGTYGTISSTITSLGSNQFQASTPYLGGGQQFYRIQHN